MSGELIDLGVKIGGSLATLFVTWQGTMVAWKKFKKSMMRPKGKNACDNCMACKTNLFPTLDYYIRIVESPTFKLCNGYKTKVAKDMLLDKFTEGKEALPKLFCYVQNFDSNKAFSELVKGTMKMIKDYNAKWMAKGINVIIRDGVNGLYQPNVDSVFRDVATQFKKKHLSKRETMERVSIAFEEAYANFFRSVIQFIDEQNGSMVGDVYDGCTNTGEYVKLIEHDEYAVIMSAIQAGESFSIDK